MIDIHCHPLPAVDDGAESLEVSVAMLRMAAADGITHTVATPHCNYRYPFDPEYNRQKAVEVQAAIGDTPKILLGCDFHLSYENLRNLLDNQGRYTINGSNYVLVEPAEHFVPQQFERVFYEMQVAGLTPIITHPERNPVFRSKPELVYDWVRRGCLVQITAQSYTGGFGNVAEFFSGLWLDHNLVHFFATDAHDAEFRPPLLSPCYAKLAAARGQEIADLIMKKNPEAVISNQPVPYRPEPSEPAKGEPKRSWLAFFGLRRRRSKVPEADSDPAAMDVDGD